EPLSIIGLMVGEPISRFALSILQPIESYFRGTQRRRQKCRNNPPGSHWKKPARCALRWPECCGRPVEKIRHFPSLTSNGQPTLSCPRPSPCSAGSPNRNTPRNRRL